MTRNNRRPGRSRGRSVPATALVLSVFLGACAGDDKGGGSQAGGPSGTPETAPSLFPTQFMVVADSTLAGAPLDSLKAVRAGTGTIGIPILNEPGQWALDYTWFYLFREPIQLFTFEQMDSLDRTGAIDDSLEVGIATYRIRIAADTPGKPSSLLARTSLDPLPTP